MKFRGWLEDSGITHVDLGRWEDDQSGSAPIVSVKICGEYGEGRKANRAAQVIRMSVAAALTADFPKPRGLLLDVSEMQYFGGDSLLSWLFILDEKGISPDAFGVSWYCSSMNAEHVRSLIDEFGETQMTVCLSLPEALAALDQNS